LVIGIDGRLVDVDSKDCKQCSICRTWFYKQWLRSHTYCISCQNDYQKFRRLRIDHDKRNGGYTHTDRSVPRFRELYMSGILGDTYNMTPWVDKWRPGHNDHIVPTGAIALPEA